MTPAAEGYRYARHVPRESGYDVVVAGGGPAGTAAAVCAARLGAKVLLLEAEGCLGGMGTSGLVTAWDGMADGERTIVGGFMNEIVETLYERGELPDWTQPACWREKLLCPTRFHPEPVKRLLDELAADAGVEVRFFARAVDVGADADARTVHGLLVAHVDGLRFVEATTFVDATGDAWLAHHVGAPCRLAGRDTPDIMPASLCWIGSGVASGRTGNPKDQVEQARADGDFPYNEFRSVNSHLGPGLVGFNAGHLYGLDATDPVALSRGMAEGRRIARDYTRFFRKYVPGYENLDLTSTASLMGVRETRRIVGEYELTYDDYRNWRHFPDQVGIFNKEVDIHVYSDDPQAIAEHERLRDARPNWPGPGDSYGIPYGVIVPRGWKNLWCPGRSASCDVTVQGSLRVMPAAAMMGQAAGTAAVQCIRTGQAACDLDTAALVETLRANGAVLPQETLSHEMTRHGAPK